MTGAGLLAGLTGVVFTTGLLLLAAGLRPVAAEPGGAGADWPARIRRLRPAWATRRRLASAAAGAAAVQLAVGWPVAAAAAGAGVLAVPRLLSGRAVARQLARLDGLEAWTRRLADILGSGVGGLEQAIGGSVRTCPAAIRAEVTALAGRIPVCGVEAGLRGFADDLADTGSPAADMVAAALILRARRGGRGLRPVLAALAEDVAELVRARRAAEADRAKPRANARALTGLTAAVMAATLLFARGYLAPFAGAGGQAMLAVVAGLFAAGFALMARITRPPTGIRLLAPLSTADELEARPWT